jgi:ABC-type transport system substrate-binding protein
VVFTYELQLENTGWIQGSSARALVKQDAGAPAADAVTKVDEDSVMFKLDDKFGTFLSALSTVFICPEHIWELKIAALAALDPPVALGDYAPEAEATFADEVIGSGPFKFDEYVDTQYVKYVANENYWNGAPKIDELVFKIFQEEDAATLAFKGGSIDALAMVETPTDVPLLLQDSNIEIDMLTANNHTCMLFLNMRKPPLHLLDVRKAVDMTIDRQALINSATYGYGSLPQQVPFAGGLAESNPDIAWVDKYVDGEGELLDQEIRVANANSLLDAIPGMSDKPAEPPAGWVRTWTDPVTGVAVDLEFDFNYIGAPTYQRGATEITIALEDIGIQLNPAPFAGGMFGPTLFSGMMVWAYDFVIFGYPSPPEFDQLVKQWCNNPFGANYDGSVVGFNNNRADPYVDNGAAKPGDPDYAPQRPQTYDTPDWDTATAAEKTLYKNIYDGIVEWATPIEDDLYATKTMSDPAARLAAIMDVQEDFADALPILCMYHEVAMSAYRTDRLTGWGDPEGVFFYGNSPSSISPLTLVNVELK